ncbi:MAG: cytochrome c [Thermodesulfobacteriota bacterium]
MNLRLYIIAIISLISLNASIYDKSYAQHEGLSQSPISGEELFIQNRCVRCHTIGRGRFVGPDLLGIGEKYSEQQIITWIENPQLIYQQSGKMPVNEGYPPMPPTNVPADQAKLIAEYLTSFKPSETLVKKGVISGQVVNETNKSPELGVDLTLTSYMGDRATDEKTIKSDEEGNYKFADLRWDRSYELTINYKGTQYSTDKMVFKPDESKMELNLPIYEPTFDESDINIIERQVIVQASDQALNIANITLYSNDGDKIYVGGNETQDGRKESLKLNIPNDAQDINFIHGVNPDDLIKTNYGFADTTSMLPGQKRVVYTYNIPLESGTIQFDQLIEYPTQNFLLLISDTNKTATVSGLSPKQSVDVQGEKFLKWTGESLESGAKIELKFEGDLLKSDYLKYAALGFLLLIVVIGIIYSSYTKQKSKMTKPDLVEDFSIQKTKLMKEIAKLDDDFESGNIDENSYRDIRENKKNELKKIIRRL